MVKVEGRRQVTNQLSFVQYLWKFTIISERSSCSKFHSNNVQPFQNPLCNKNKQWLYSFMHSHKDKTVWSLRKKNEFKIRKHS